MLPPTYYCAGTLDTDELLGIFVASLRAVSCAAALAFAGLHMASRGMMTPGLSRGLSQFSMKLAIPCLLFRSVVPGVSYSLLAYAWPLMLLPAVYVIVGTLLGMLMLVVVKPPEDFRIGTVAACALGNTTGIPIIVLTVLQQSLTHSVFADLDDPVMYLSLPLLTYPVTHWTHSLLLLKMAGLLSPKPSTEEEELDAVVSRRRQRQDQLSPRTRRAGGPSTALLSLTESVDFQELPSSIAQELPGSISSDTAATPLNSRILAIDSQASNIDELGSFFIENSGRAEEGAGSPAVPRQVDSRQPVGFRLYAMVKDADLGSASRKFTRMALKLMRRILVPSVWGILLGAAVGLLAKPLVLPPETSPLGWLYIGVCKLGDAAVPVNLVLLGGALSRPPRPSVLPPLTILGLVLARMVLMPLCGLLIVYLLATRGATLVMPYMSVDPFWLVSLIVTCTPTANNVVVLTEIAGENRHAMSAAIFYQYCTAPVLLPGVLTLFVASICRIRDLSTAAPDVGSM